MGKIVNLFSCFMCSFVLSPFKLHHSSLHNAQPQIFPIIRMESELIQILFNETVLICAVNNFWQPVSER